MAEETLLLKENSGSLKVLQPEEYRKYLDVQPSANLDDRYIVTQLTRAQKVYESCSAARAEISDARAEKLFSDLTKFRKASNLRGTVKTSPCGDMDLLGTYVFVPSGEDL